MNKYLLMSAAAVLATTAGGAQAGSPLHSFQFGTSGGGSYCDGGTVYTNGSSVWAWQHTNNNCSGGVSIGDGRLGKQSGFGKGADMGDNLYAKNYGIYSVNLDFLLPKKLATGKAWQLDVDFSGTTAFVGNSGVLINVVAGHKGHKSTTTALKTLIAAHKAAKQHG